METRNVRSILLRKKIPLEAAKVENRFILLKIQPMLDYQDGKRTDVISGYTYECVDQIDYNRYSIKVKAQLAPLMTDEELQQLRENGEKVVIKFRNPTVYLFYNTAKEAYQDAFSAENVELLRSE